MLLAANGSRQMNDKTHNEVTAHSGVLFLVMLRTLFLNHNKSADYVIVL